MRHFTLLLLFLFLTFSLKSQDMQLGLTGGIALYQGDLQPENAVNLEAIGEIGYTGGAFARFIHNGNLSTRLDFRYGFISADDANSNSPGRRARNFSFQSSLFELSLTEEIHFVRFDPSRGNFIAPFFSIGVGAVYFNPKTEYNGNLVELQPLGTEGQGMPGFPEKYRLLQVAIPVGGGLNIALNRSTTLTLEAGARKLFTDYLDDVSGFYVNEQELIAGNGQLAAELAYRRDEITGMPLEVETGEARRGGPEFDDWYIFVNVGLAFEIDGSTLFGGTGKGCPTW